MRASLRRGPFHWRYRIAPVCQRRNLGCSTRLSGRDEVEEEVCMNQLIYLVGLIVVILAILSFFGLR
jgi:hypothetical protein